MKIVRYRVWQVRARCYSNAGFSGQEFEDFCRAGINGNLRGNERCYE